MTREDIEKLLEWMNVRNYYFNEEKQQFSCSCPLARWEHQNGVDYHPSLGIKLGKPCLAHCFACGIRGLEPLVEKYCEYTGLDSNKPLNQIKERNEVTLLDRLADSDYQEFERSRPLVLDDQILEQFRPYQDSQAAVDYLCSRGIELAVADEFNLMYDPNQHRVVFPVYDRAAQLRGAVGRAISSSNPKRYENYFNFKSGAVLGGEDKLSHDIERIYLVEGWVDLVKCYIWSRELGGVPVCSWRAELSATQASHLTAYDAMIFCCYDRDKAGDKGWKVLRSYFGNLAKSRLVDMRPKEGDIGDISKADFVSLYNSASELKNLIGG